MPILVALKTAFTMWMLVDAARRRAPCFWYAVIMMPFGELVYFFTVKIHDPEFRVVKCKLCSKPVSIEELKHNAEHSPSIHNQVLCAQALHDHKHYREAAQLFEAVLASDSQNKHALYGLGLCLQKLQRTNEAIVCLSKVVEIDFSYENYAPAVDLASAYWNTGRRSEAIELLESVSKKNARLPFQVELARYLTKNNERQRAKTVLERAVDDYNHSPQFVRKKDRRWAKEARTLLRAL